MIRVLKIITMTRIFAAAFLTVCAAAAAAPTHPEWELYAHPQRLVDIGGRRLNVYCNGKGSPTVILDGGLGSDITEWRFVQPAIAKTTQVCAYDRAGNGFSDPAPLPRDAKALAADLSSLLRAARIDGPYVLVGQSLAGLHIRLFADEHPDEVAGMVLVDPSFEHQVQRYEAAIPSYAAGARRQVATFRSCITILKNGTPPVGSNGYRDCIGDTQSDLPPDVVKSEIARANSDSYRMALSELEGLEGASSDQVEASRHPYGDMPLIVLSSDMPPRSDADTRTRMQIWYAMHAKIAQLSSRGEHRIVPGSSHHIQESKPDAVIAAIGQVLNAVRGR